MQTKICTSCGDDKPVSEYHKHKSGKNGLNPVCKSCRSIQSKERETPAYSRNRTLLGRYGISSDTFNEMLENQNYKCAGCGTDSSKFEYPLQVDHCHTTGKVRGLLCRGCNVALGCVKDDVNTLLSLVDYLQK